MPEIKVPAVLAGGASSTTVSVEGESLREAFDAHASEHGPELRDSVVEGDTIREYINVYVDGEDVSRLDGLDTEVDEESQIRVIPAASGGGVGDH